jgi:hypothetical protein
MNPNLDEILAANPNLGKEPFPCFSSTDEPTLFESLEDRGAIKTSVQRFSHLLPNEGNPQND